MVNYIITRIFIRPINIYTESVFTDGGDEYVIKLFSKRGYWVKVYSTYLKRYLTIYDYQQT